MTRIRSPRELRIVVAQPPAAGAAAGARFGQLLGQARQALDLLDRDRPSGDGGDGKDGQERHDGEDAPEPAGIDAACPLPPPRPRLPAPPQATTSAPDATIRALGARIVSHCARATGADLVADHLAERIARFCASPALEHAGGRWEVVVELDPAILPRTRLHLLLSDGTLSLRFDTRDAGARQLICDNGAALRSRLEARLGARIIVHLEVS